MDEYRLLTRSVRRHEHGTLSEGDTLTDAPETEKRDELKSWTQDRKEKKWRMRVHGVRLCKVENRILVSFQTLFVPK